MRSEAHGPKVSDLFWRQLRPSGTWPYTSK